MKKIIAAVAVVFALASCTKDWTCECTGTFEGETYTESTVFAGQKRSEANDKCKAIETLVKAGAQEEGVTGKGSCKLK